MRMAASRYRTTSETSVNRPWIVGRPKIPRQPARPFDSDGANTLELMSNIRLAIRSLIKTPFVTFVAVVSLALGIGATSAIFSLFNQMLLRPLPVKARAQLVNLPGPGPKPGNNSCNQAGQGDQVFTYPMFRDLEKAQAVFTG